MTGRLKAYLDENRAAYRVLSTPEETYTAQETAHKLHVSGKELLKVVVVKTDGQGFHLAVVPAARLVDLRKVAEVVGADRASLASEGEFQERFPDCEVGAEPPFGHLYGIDTLVDEHVMERGEVAFLAGSHHEAVEMSRADFERLARPKVGDFCKPWQ